MANVTQGGNENQSSSSGQNGQVPITASASLDIAPSLDFGGHSSASGSIGNTIVYPPGVPGGDAFALGGSSGLIRQVCIGVAVFVIATYAMKHLKKI